MKVGDRVRSKKYDDLEGEIQEIGPCDQCDRTRLTLDPKGSGLIAFYHAEDFEFVHQS